MCRSQFAVVTYRYGDPNQPLDGVAMPSKKALLMPQEELAPFISLEEWEKIFDAISDPVMILDTFHRIVRANAAMVQLLGLRGREAISLFCYQAVHHVGAPSDHCPHRLLLADGHPKSAEIDVPELGRTFQIDVTPLVDSGGNLVGSLHFAKDITAKKQAEEKAVRINRLYTVLSKVNAAIVRIRKPVELFCEVCKIAVEDGLFRMAWIGTVAQGSQIVSPVAHFGLEAGYLKDLRFSIDPELPAGIGPTGTALREGRCCINNDTATNPAMTAWRDEALKRGYRSSCSLPLISGRILTGVITLYATVPDYFNDEELRLLSSLADDLSFGLEVVDLEAARNSALEALEREKSFIACILRDSAQATFVLDPQHRVLIWNPACEALTGVKQADVIGTSFHNRAFYPDQRPCLADLIIDNSTENLNSLFTKQSRPRLCPEGLQAEGHFRNLNGKDRYIMFNASPVKSDAGQLLGAIETLQDITEQKALELQLFQAQKLETIGELASGIAHDFNNVLTAIIGYSTMIKMGKDPDKTHIDQVLAAANMGAGMTKRLLAYSRQQTLTPQRINIKDIVLEMQGFLQQIAGSGIEIKMSIHGAELPVIAGSGQIEQVLMNLVANARDAMGDAGTIILETGMGEIGPDFIQAHGFGTLGKYAVISIADSGQGMCEAVRTRLFDPFFTTKEPSKGTGLGLSIVYGIIKQQNGYIDVFSELSVGTTFTVYLPLLVDGEVNQIHP